VYPSTEVPASSERLGLLMIVAACVSSVVFIRPYLCLKKFINWSEFKTFLRQAMASVLVATTIGTTTPVGADELWKDLPRGPNAISRSHKLNNDVPR
jgi:hypothetical protein